MLSSRKVKVEWPLILISDPVSLPSFASQLPKEPRKPCVLGFTSVGDATPEVAAGRVKPGKTPSGMRVGCVFGGPMRVVSNVCPPLPFLLAMSKARMASQRVRGAMEIVGRRGAEPVEALVGGADCVAAGCGGATAVVSPALAITGSMHRRAITTVEGFLRIANIAFFHALGTVTSFS